MNIFVLHRDPVKSAKLMCDKHVVKMILESAQMLSTVHHLNGSDIDVNVLYKPTHKHHPSTVWACEHESNYIWLYKHFIALCDEYTLRYNKTHLTFTKLAKLLATLPNFSINLPSAPPLAMPEQYWVTPNKYNNTWTNVIKSYQSYYYHEKRYFAKYTNTDVPSFMKIMPLIYNKGCALT